MPPKFLKSEAYSLNSDNKPYIKDNTYNSIKRLPLVVVSLFNQTLYITSNYEE